MIFSNVRLDKFFNMARRRPSAFHFHRSAAVLILGLALFGCAARNPVAENPENTKNPKNNDAPLSLIIRFYQGPLDHLSSVRVGACPMHPNCSEFALTAMERHGFLMGWTMACDRLMRCGGDETLLSPEVLVDGRFRYMDTLEQNDCWWFQHSKNYPPVETRPAYQSREWGISIE